MDNPLLHPSYYPDFARIRPEQVEPAMRALLAEATEAVDRLERDLTPTWDGLMDPLYRACEPVSESWGIVTHLLSVCNNEDWRRAHDAIQPDIVAFGLRVSQSQAFYRGYRALRDADLASPTLTGPRRRILASALREAEQSGVGLTGAAHKRFNAIQQELAGLFTAFGNHLHDAIREYTLWMRDPADSAGLPASLLSAAAAAAREAGEPRATTANGPWRITLDIAILAPFLKHCRNRSLRESLTRASVTQASSGAHDNSERIERILALRREMAALLGTATYADLSLTRKMAPSVEAVDRLLADLADAARQPAARERADLLAFAREKGFSGDALAQWDIPFWAERRREALYAYSEEELRPYFPFPQVLDGLFALTERLFGVRIEPADGTAPVWHPDVRFFQVSENGTVQAGFYLDPYCRPATKRHGAWMDPLRTRDRRPDGSLRPPLAMLVCNQTPPDGARPSLMRFDEVTTLFHEFGHALQHLLTTVDDPAASGIHNIEWDAVELASQFMENWCHEPGTLRDLSRHIETGARLSADWIAKIRAARNDRAASNLLRQVFFGVLDMDLHARYPRPEWPDANAVKIDAARRLLPLPLLPEDRFLCSFSHLFAGGYAAGYYGYKWSEVLSADAFSAFEEAGLDRPEAVRATGRRFRNTFLASGGGTPPMELFRAFRGRDPSVEALLRHAGLRGPDRR